MGKKCPFTKETFLSHHRKNNFCLVKRETFFDWSSNKYLLYQIIQNTFFSGHQINTFFFMAMKETFLSNSQTNTFRVKKLSVSQKSIFSSGHNRKIQSFLFSGYLKYIVHSPKKHFCPFMKEKFLSVHQRNLFSLLTKETAFFVHSSKKYILSIHQRKHFFVCSPKKHFCSPSKKILTHKEERKENFSSNQRNIFYLITKE